MLLARSRPRVPRSWRRRTLFPHGFSATEPLVPPSTDGSTPITDALPRSILLDPTAYKPKLNFRDKPPSKDPTVQLSPLEKNLIVNPFGTVPALTMLTVLAKILASKHRTDRTSQSALPRGALQGNITLIVDLLIRFGVFTNTETKNGWLLPDDSRGRGGNTSGYRILRKTAVHELGGRQKNKKWGVVAPILMPEKAKKNLVWRDGMGEHVLSLYREEAWKRLDGLSRKFLYEVELDEKLKTANVGRPMPRRFKKEGSTQSKDLQHHQQAQSNESLSEEQTNLQPQSRTTTPESVIGNENESIAATSHEETDEPLHISAVFYLGPDALRNAPWEIRPISVDNQLTSATIFNLRRLFPTIADKYMNRLTDSTIAVAVQSSEISCTTLYHMLRLAFYLEGDITVNMTGEEKDKYEMEVGFGKFRLQGDQDDNAPREIEAA
jgi:hypothetical protein